MTIKVIPPKNFSNYVMEIKLSNEIVYNLRFYWNYSFQFWSVSFYDRDNTPLLLGRKINNGAGIFRYLSDYGLPDGDIYPASENDSEERINEKDFIENIFSLIEVSADEFGETLPETLNLATWSI